MLTAICLNFAKKILVFTFLFSRTLSLVCLHSRILLVLFLFFLFGIYRFSIKKIIIFVNRLQLNK